MARRKKAKHTSFWRDCRCLDCRTLLQKTEAIRKEDSAKLERDALLHRFYNRGNPSTGSSPFLDGKPFTVGKIGVCLDLSPELYKFCQETCKAQELGLDELLLKLLEIGYIKVANEGISAVFRK